MYDVSKGFLGNGFRIPKLTLPTFHGEVIFLAEPSSVMISFAIRDCKIDCVKILPLNY